MPLVMAKAGEKRLIQKIGGKNETKSFLEGLGFVAGSSVSIITETAGNLIVLIKDSRIAISREMACKIIV